jgi:hypothetical protein
VAYCWGPATVVLICYLWPEKKTAGTENEKR